LFTINLLHAAAMAMVKAELNDEHFRGPHHRLGSEFWIRELRILAAEILLNHPTGGRTSLSNEDRYL
jgi:hypothetical protein